MTHKDDLQNKTESQTLTKTTTDASRTEEEPTQRQR